MLLFHDVRVGGLDSVHFTGGQYTTKEAMVHATGELQLHCVFVPRRVEVERDSVRTDGAERLRTSVTVRSIPAWLSVLPPLLAIVLALLLRQVVVSLVAGIWLGAFFVFGYNPFTAFLHVLDHYIVNALADEQHMSIIAFSMLFGGMVGVMSRSGGTSGIAEKLAPMARTPRRGQLATWLLGFVVFFDDYANTLIVGNTMRPITDRLRVSREKLAYIVDSTAAPISSVLFISTWIGYEVGLIDQAMQQVGMMGRSAYALFLAMIPFSFYPIFALVFALAVIVMKRDFASMAKAERRARVTGMLNREGAPPAADLTDSSSVMPAIGVKARWWNAAIPICTVIVAAISGLYVTGTQSILDAGGSDFSVGSVIGQADSYRALLWASLLACVVAIVLAVVQRTLSIAQAMDAWFNGLKSMLLAMLILTLAWSIGQITADIHTASYLVQILRGNLDPRFLPMLTFLIAAAVSFATGTSWGTMGIMMPLVFPLAVLLGSDAGLDPSHAETVLLGTVASVLSGAVFGDHCSPISDTTILSSMASACDHIDHVRTQLPYAILPASIAVLFGLIPAGFNVHPAYSIPIALAVMIVLLRLFGRNVEHEMQRTSTARHAEGS